MIYYYRDTELACLPLEAMNAIKIKKPQVNSTSMHVYSNMKYTIIFDGRNISN